MKTHHRAMAAAAFFFSSAALHAATLDRVTAEMEGIDLDVDVARAQAAPSDTARTQAGIPPGVTELLLIPESTNDRVMAFDTQTGDLVDADFIPADPTNLTTPIHAILAADGQSVLVSDQTRDVVQQYDLDGNYVGIFAPAGGVDNSVLDNIRGIALAPNGNLLVSVGGGANDDAIAEFDTSGAFLGNRVANGAGGLNNPFDVFVSGTTLLVGGIDSDQIHRYDLSGAALAALAPVNTFPEQIALAGNGNVLVSNFSGAQEGVMEFTSAGALVGIYNPATVGGNRGVYELPNGNLLTTNSTGVFEIDRAGNLVDTKIDGVGARFIERAVFPPLAAPAPPAPALPVPVGSPIALLALIALIAFVTLRQRRRRASP